MGGIVILVMTEFTPLQRALLRLDEVTTPEEKSSPMFRWMQTWIRGANENNRIALKQGDFPCPSIHTLDQNVALMQRIKNSIQLEEDCIRRGRQTGSYFCDEPSAHNWCILLVGIPFYFISKYNKKKDRLPYEISRQEKLKECAIMRQWMERMEKISL